MLYFERVLEDGEMVPPELAACQIIGPFPEMLPATKRLRKANRELKEEATKAIAQCDRLRVELRCAEEVCHDLRQAQKQQDKAWRERLLETQKQLAALAESSRERHPLWEEVNPGEFHITRSGPVAPFCIEDTTTGRKVMVEEDPRDNGPGRGRSSNVVAMYRAMCGLMEERLENRDWTI